MLSEFSKLTLNGIEGLVAGRNVIADEAVNLFTGSESIIEQQVSVLLHDKKLLESAGQVWRL